jgi:TolB-like protein
MQLNFFEELKRRRVIRVAVVYAVTAWLIAQIIAVVNEPLNLPDWFDTVLMVFLMIGFPIALILTWAFEVTPEGVQPTRSKEEGGLQVMALGRSRFDYAIIGLLVVAVGWLIFRTEFDTPEPEPPALPVAVLPAEPQFLHNSIAVLPFDNLSPDPNDAYFAAGMHEEVLNQLAKIKDLSIIARTSVLQYAGAKRPISEIAAELKVGAVMEGSVRYAGDRVRITAQLNDAKTGMHLWSEAYDRDLADIFAIQLDIALKITEAMKAEFSIAEQEAAAKVLTDNPEAYAHYVKALSQLGGLGPVKPAHAELDIAIALDPEFALALATKAWLYAAAISFPFEDFYITAENQQRHAGLATEYAKRALAIDADQGGAYYALSEVDRFERRWRQADANVVQAYQLAPVELAVAIGYSNALITQGRWAEAVPIYERTFALNPANGILPLIASEWMGGHGQMDVAIGFARTSILLFPGFHRSYIRLALLSAMNGDTETALEMAKKSEAMLANSPNKLGTLELMETYYWLRRPNGVARLFELLQIAGETDTLNHGDLFRAHFALDEFETALDHLDTAIDARFPGGMHQILGTLLVSRYFEPLWGHPRYEAALHKLEIEDVYPRPNPL